MLSDIQEGLKRGKAGGALVTADATKTTIYTVSTGESRKFVLERMIVHNDDAAATIVSIFDGTTDTGIKFQVAANTTFPLDFSSSAKLGGLEFETSVVVEYSVGDPLSSCTAIGYEY